ncbi:MAG: hypothetical protein P4L50_16235 [Anaerolineaceae bacterium]|nr:hypothetical protein [Anaerolineaceae bacterium]
MIDFGKILKRAWQILWNYKVLWIFGVLLALTGGGSRPGGGNSGSQFNANNNSSSSNPTMNQFGQQFNHWFQQNIQPLLQYPGQHIGLFIGIGLGLLLFLLIVGAILAIVRYVSETAAIRMANEYEQSGSKVGFREGWRLGWSRAAFRMWLIDLITGLPFLLFVLILLGLGALVYFGATNPNRGITAVSIAAAVGFFILFLIVFIVLAVLISLLRKFFVRVAALENATLGASFRQGWLMFKRNWKSAGLMWLIMLGVGIAASIAMVIIFFLLIPAYIVLFLPAAVVAAIPGLVVFGITSIFASGPLTWILALVAALPFFFIILFAPLILISGGYIIYENNVWTLTYREIKALENIAPTETASPDN